MENIVITTQQEFDKLVEVKEAQSVRVECEVNLNKVLTIRGKILFCKKTDMSFGDSRYVEARDNSSVVARGNSSVVAWDNSSVVARGNSSVEARDNSSVVAWDNSSVVARDNSSVVAWDNSSVVAWGNSSVVARENSIIRVFASLNVKLSLFGFSVLFKPHNLALKFKKSKTALVQDYKPQKYLDREGIQQTKGNIILFKRVSFDYKTQEGTRNETIWKLKSILTHPAWNPQESECGEGKYHACSRPYFCDEFRSNKTDIYIAVKIAKKDLFEWKDASYPHKIAFRKGTVLYRCDRFGKEIK
jgi:hypothetical protein